MTDIPTIMSAPMVQATLREIEQPGTGKTMTRRVLYGKRKAKDGIISASATFLQDHPPPRGKLSPEGFPTDIAVNEYWALTGWHKVKPGDRLWVRETWRASADFDFYDQNFGRVPRPSEIPAGSIIEYLADDENELGGKTRVCLHMPRWASRLTLIVKGEPPQSTAFSALWEMLHGPGSWAANPEVVAISFRPVLSNIDALPKQEAA